MFEIKSRRQNFFFSIVYLKFCLTEVKVGTMTYMAKSMKWKHVHERREKSMKWFEINSLFCVYKSV